MTRLLEAPERYESKMMIVTAYRVVQPRLFNTPLGTLLLRKGDWLVETPVGQAAYSDEDFSRLFVPSKV